MAPEEKSQITIASWIHPLGTMNAAIVVEIFQSGPGSGHDLKLLMGSFLKTFQSLFTFASS